MPQGKALVKVKVVAVDTKLTTTQQGPRELITRQKEFILREMGRLDDLQGDQKGQNLETKEIHRRKDSKLKTR